MLPRRGWRQDGMSPARSHRPTVLRSVPRSREIWRKEAPAACRRTASSKRARRPACAAGPRGVVAASGPSVTGVPAVRAPPATSAAIRRDPPSGDVVALHDGLKRIAEVAQQMPPVRDLDSIWRSLPDAVGVDAGAVTRDDLHPRVPLQPRRQALDPAVRQQVEYPVLLQVDEDGPVAVTAPPRPIIDPEHARGRAWPWRGIATARHPQQRVRADGDGQPRRKACAGLSANNEAEVAL